MVSSVHEVAAATRASCAASSHASNCPYRRIRPDRTCGASSRRSLEHDLTYLDAHALDRGVGDAGGEFERPLAVGELEHVETAEELLGLQVRPVGDGRLPVANPHDSAARRLGQRLRDDQLTGLLRRLDEPGVAVLERLLAGLVQSLEGRRVVVQHQQELHLRTPFTAAPLAAHTDRSEPTDGICDPGRRKVRGPASTLP
jgi:hypothetical protein